MKKKKTLPKIIQEVGFDFWWDNKKLWSLDLPVEEIGIDLLEWHFDIPFWDKSNGYYDLTPTEVIIKKEEHSKEYERVMKSNLIYPLDIMFWKERWLLLDGLHRLVKAKVLGHKKVKVRKVDKKFVNLIKK